MDKSSKYIVFLLNDQAFGVKVKQISSIERLQNITKLPRTQDFIKGIINHRGETTPVIDLKARLDKAKKQTNKDNRFLIVQMDNMQIGLLVDAATEVIDIPSTVIKPAPEIIGEEKETFIEGIAKFENRVLTLLDLQQILDFNETNEVEEIVG